MRGKGVQLVNIVDLKVSGSYTEYFDLLIYMEYFIIYHLKYLMEGEDMDIK